MFQNKIQIFPGNNFLFSQGDVAKNVYFILEGRISIVRDSKRVLSLSSHNVVGLEGVYDSRGIYPYSALCDVETRAIVYPIEAIPEVFMENYMILEKILSSLSYQLSSCWSLIGRTEIKPQGNFFMGEIITVAQGEYVIKEGENTTDIYKIISTDEGLEVSKEGKVLTILKEPGQFFGEMAAILREPRTASVKSIGNSVLEVYSADALFSLLEDYPDLSFRIIKDLSKRLAAANELILKGTKDG